MQSQMHGVQHGVQHDPIISLSSKDDAEQPRFAALEPAVPKPATVASSLSERIELLDAQTRYCVGVYKRSAPMGI